MFVLELNLFAMLWSPQTQIINIQTKNSVALKFYIFTVENSKKNVALGFPGTSRDLG